MISICFIYGLIINTFYRSYVFNNKIDDYGIASIGNNLTFVPVVYLIYLYFKKPTTALSIWICFLLFATIEVISYFFPILGTFDFKDILGLFIGTLLLKLFLKYV